MQEALRASLDLRRTCAAEARAEIRHLPKPSPSTTDEKEKQQLQTLMRAKSEAQQDRFLELKLMHELGAMEVVQKKDPKEAQSFLEEAVSGFEDFAEAGQPDSEEPDPNGSQGPPKEVAQQEQANTLYHLSQFFARQRDFPRAERVLDQAGSLYNELKNEEGMRNVAMAADCIAKSKLQGADAPSQAADEENAKDRTANEDSANEENASTHDPEKLEGWLEEPRFFKEIGAGEAKAAEEVNETDSQQDRVFAMNSSDSTLQQGCLAPDEQHRSDSPMYVRWSLGKCFVVYFGSFKASCKYFAVGLRLRG